MKISLSMLTFVLFLFLLIAPLHPQAQAETVTVTDTVNQTEVLSQARDQIIDGLFVVLGGVLLGAFTLIGTLAYALYKSTPPTFQNAFLEGVRGIIATAEETLKNKAIEAQKTPTDIDDRIIKAFDKALSEFAKRFDKDKEEGV